MSKIIARREAVYGLYRYGDFTAIAQKTGLSASTVSRALRGEPCAIRPARKICDLFGAKFSDFFELKKEVRIHE